VFVDSALIGVPPVFEYTASSVLTSSTT
jgi:hypothetical protein